MIDEVRAHAFRIPTESPESDGTAAWDSTTLVLVELRAADLVGLGYTYSHDAAARLIDDHLAPHVTGCDPMHTLGIWKRMQEVTRNLGTRSVAAAAISAVDNAAWDLKARLLGVALADLLPACRTAVPLYGSGGFTSYSDDELTRQFSWWVEQGFRMVKMKIGREPERDVQRMSAARRAIGDDVALFIDANGAFGAKQAVKVAEAAADFGVTWFEEPVTSDDLDGLWFVRDHAPAGMEIAAGEYGWDQLHFRRLLQAGAVDVLQADATRCAGITGFLAAGALAQAWSIDLSAHTAPHLHAHACCGVARLRNVEYFFDHARIERMLFDGVLEPQDGAMQPDRSRPGMGIAFKWEDAERYRIYGRSSQQRSATAS